MKKIWSTWVEIRKIKYFNTKINLIPIELRVAINRWRQLPDRCRSFWNISQSFFHRRIKPGHSDKSTFEYRYERVRHAAAIDRPTGGGEAHNLSTFYTKRCNKNHLRESKAIYQAILSVNYYNFCRGVWRSHNIKKENADASCHGTLWYACASLRLSIVRGVPFPGLLMQRRDFVLSLWKNKIDRRTSNISVSVNDFDCTWKIFLWIQLTWHFLYFMILSDLMQFNFRLYLRGLYTAINLKVYFYLILTSLPLATFLIQTIIPR